MSWNQFATIPHSDDATGLIARYSYRDEQLKTRLGYNVNYTNGSLSTFTAVQQLAGADYAASGVRPAIVGNWHQGIGGTYNWDYAAVWIRSSTLKIALLKDLDDGTLQVRAITTIPVGNTFFTPSIAVGSANQLLVVWKNFGTVQNLLTIARVQVNSQGNGFTSITTSTFPNYQPLSEPVVSFMPGRYRYVISWVMDGYTGMGNRHRIAAMVSADSTGTTWNAPYTYEGNDPEYPEFVSSTWAAPAITCYNGLLFTNTCLMLYRQFRTADSLSISQQAFAMNGSNTYLVSSDTDWDTLNTSHASLAVASSLDDWLYTRVQPNGGQSYMFYKIKPFSQGPGGHYRTYASKSRTDMISRAGFPVAYNYRTDRFRFFWIER